MIAEHPAAQPSYTMHKLGQHKFNLHRQILESLMIEEASKSKSKVLNRKSEWGRAKLARIVITDNSQGT